MINTTKCIVSHLYCIILYDVDAAPPLSYANAKDAPASFFPQPRKMHCAAPICFAGNNIYAKSTASSSQYAVEQLVQFHLRCRATSRSSNAHFVVRADASRPSAALLFSISEQRPARELLHKMCCVLQTSITITISRGTSTLCPIVLTQGPSLLTFNIVRYRIASPIWVPTLKRQIC